MYAHLLEEAIESFLRQTYPADSRELIVFNDCPQQRLSMNNGDLPGVRIINCDKRYPSLGDKYNAAIEAARFDVLMPWEDDDISLPGRLTQAALVIGNGYDYFNPGRTWFQDHLGIRCDHKHGYCHNASAYTRQAWARAGKYPPNCKQDAVMDMALKRTAKTSPILSDDPATWTYIYRWGVSNFHLSGQQYPDTAYHQVTAKAGEYTLMPFWRIEYAGLCRMKAIQHKVLQR